mgnify:CR=1 FL=1
MSIIWIAFEVIINFYEGFMETYFIYKFLPPKTESTKKNIMLLHCVSVRSDY